MRRLPLLAAVALVSAVNLGLTSRVSAEEPAMTLRSSAFKPGQPIPAKYTCAGPNLSPPLSWDAPPAGAQSLVLVCDDPDAPGGTWTHWVIFNMPVGAGKLVEGLPPQTLLPDGSRQGVNDFHSVGYGGPCPPPGGVHHYHFTLYALSTTLDLPPRANKTHVVRGMTGHLLGQTELVGTYRR